MSNTAASLPLHPVDFKTIFASHPHPMVVVDESAVVLATNTAAETFLPSPPEALFTDNKQMLQDWLSRATPGTVGTLHFSTASFACEAKTTPLESQFFLIEFSRQNGDDSSKGVAALFAKIAHDISSPITLLKLSTECFEMDVESGEALTKEDLSEKVDTYKGAMVKIERALKILKKASLMLDESPEELQNLIREHGPKDCIHELS